MAHGNAPLPPPPPGPSSWTPPAKGFWARRSTKGKAGILTVAAATAFMFANGGSGGADPTASTAATAPADAQVLATPAELVAPAPTGTPPPPLVAATSTPAPTPSPALAPTPKPTPRLVVVSDSLWVSDAKLALRGKTGVYKWTSVMFEPDRTLLRWTVDAGKKACEIKWIINPDSGDGLAKLVKVDAGDEVKGSKKFSTSSIYEAVVSVKSTCPKFLLTMVEAPATRSASSSNCDPNYSGACVPIVSYDLDCPDIGQSVYVVGNDPHGFDADRDGYGCESYP